MQDILFDESIITNIITPELIAGIIIANAGENPTSETVINAFNREELNQPIIDILTILRSMNLLKEIPNGEERNILSVIAWNKFVRNDECQKLLWALMRCPLPNMIRSASWSAIYKSAKTMQENAKNDQPVPYTHEMIEALAQETSTSTARSAAGYERNLHRGTEMIKCRKTGEYIHFHPTRLLDPVLIQYGQNYEMKEVTPFIAPPSVRHITVTLPSGILIMADWFHIEGFNEGIGETDQSEPDINSDLGVDIRTKDHYERLGLMRIHTTNCVPAILDDNGIKRVGSFNDEDDTFYSKNQDTGEWTRNDTPIPEPLGTICCDLWDATFGDREIIADIIAAGRHKSGADTSRNDILNEIDAYAEGDFITVLRYKPGTRLHIYMATGHGSTTFHEKFRSKDISPWPFMEDMFLISEKEIDAPANIEKSGWTFPERYENLM